MMDGQRSGSINLKLRFSFAEILAFLLISGQIALYVFMWFRLLGDPSLKGMDFISFYTAGRIARQGSYPLLFDLDSQRAVQHTIVAADTFAGGVNLSQHPPYLAPLLSLLAVDDFIQAYILWTLVRLAVMGICGKLIHRFLARSGWDPLSALLGTFGALSFFPFFLGLLGGQDTAFIMLGLFLWMFGLLGADDAWSGIGLALASLSPLISGALGLPLLASRKKAGLWFVAAISGLGLYSLSLIGAQGGKDFLGLMRLSSQGEGFGLNRSAMYNLLGFLLRTFPSLGAREASLISWAAFGISIIVVIVLWWNKRENLRVEHIGIAVVLAVFSLPHLHAHGLSYLLLPLFGAATIFYKRDFKSLAQVLMPVVSMLLLVSTFMSASVNYAAYYLLMLVLADGMGLSLMGPERRTSPI